MTEQTVSVGALGRVINLSDRRIQQLVREGILSKDGGKGRYPFTTNIRQYVMYLQARADATGNVIDFEDSRKRKLHAECRLAEIELSKAESKIIPIEEHAEVIGKIGDLVKGRLIAIPSKTAPALALEDKQIICREIVESEVRETLEEIARIIADDKFIEGTEGSETAGEALPSATEVKSVRVGRPKKGSIK
jgi:hypothetical protein|tara:strand:+ start:826 stop:1401 length:576 start_codon:yes stop_codon:yes gene_type:complete